MDKSAGILSYTTIDPTQTLDDEPQPRVQPRMIMSKPSTPRSTNMYGAPDCSQTLNSSDDSNNHNKRFKSDLSSLDQTQPDLKSMVERWKKDLHSVAGINWTARDLAAACEAHKFARDLLNVCGPSL